MSTTLSRRARQFQAFHDERGTGLTALELPGSPHRPNRVEPATS
jgi:hypothetical protein